MNVKIIFLIEENNLQRKLKKYKFWYVNLRNPFIALNKILDNGI